MPTFWSDTPFKEGDRVAVYTGTPLVDSAPVGTLKQMHGGWIVLEVANGNGESADLWMPSDHVTCIRYEP
jgi:hypothetical protein